MSNDKIKKLIENLQCKNDTCFNYKCKFKNNEDYCFIVKENKHYIIINAQIQM